jgi:hypothetical protein
VIKTDKNEMGEACTTYGESRGAFRVLVRKPEGERQLGRPRHTQKDHIKIDLQEVGCGGIDWITLAQDRNRCQTCVNAVMNIPVPKNAGNFLNG